MTSSNLLRSPAFGRVWLAALASETAEWIIQVALPLHVYQVTGSATLLAVSMTIGLLSSLVVSPIAGLIVDRLNRRVTLFVVSLAQAVTALPLFVVQADTTLTPLLVIMALQTGLAALFEPARNALIPQLASESQTPAANGLMGFNTNVARLLGGWLGGLILGLGGLSWVVSVYVGLLAVTMGLLARRLPDVRERVVTSERESLARASLRGITEISRNRRLRRTIGVITLMSLSQGMFLVLFVLFVKDLLGGSEGDVGLLRGVQAIGGLAGGMLLGVIARNVLPAALLGWSLLALGALSAAMWSSSSVITAINVYVALFAILGGPAVFTGAGLLSLLQTENNDESIGRVLGIVFALGAGFQALGMQTAGALAESMTLVGLLNIQAALYLLAGVLTLVWFRRRSGAGPAS